MHSKSVYLFVSSAVTVILLILGTYFSDLLDSIFFLHVLRLDSKRRIARLLAHASMF